MIVLQKLKCLNWLPPGPLLLPVMLSAVWMKSSPGTSTEVTEICVNSLADSPLSTQSLPSFFTARPQPTSMFGLHLCQG